ncbi:MAG: hypothetical protein ABIQ95_07345, partial [Bdellovibrionia bacterium]
LFSQGQSAYQKVKDTVSESHTPSGKQVASAMSETALPRKPIETANSAAPSNTLNETITAKVRENNTNDAAVNSNIVSPIENKLLAAQKLSHPVITDQVQESAMAPLKPTASVIPSASTTMVVQTRLKRVSLHEGPGMQFPVTGIANPDIRYVVADWKDRWFKIALNAGGALNDVGWIRNDLVQIMPSNFSGSAMPNGDPLRQ